MDIAYILRPGDQQEELRYSLRTLTNLTVNVGTVWLIGAHPSWARNIEHIPGNRWGSKHANILGNWATFCEQAPAEFVAFNDDMFLMNEWTPTDAEYDGSLKDRLVTARASYRAHILATITHCEPLTPVPFNFELHRPCLINTAQLAATLDSIPPGTRRGTPQWRSVYGNQHQLAATPTPDMKARHPTDRLPPAAIWSTNDHTFRHGYTGQHIRDTWTKPSPWETT